MQAYMDFMMKILYLVSSIRCAPLDFFFSTVTHLGEETVFLVIGLTVFWCLGKRQGYYVLLTGLTGTAVNQWLKLMFKIPRPWVHDPNFKPVGSAIEEATGYSFPSGHTQNVAGTLGPISKCIKSRKGKIALVIIIALVAFSRIYLGVHTVCDVLVSLVIAYALTMLFYPLFSTDERFEKSMPFVIVFSAAVSVFLLLYVFLIPRDTVDAQNLYSGMKNASTLFGCMLALVPVYFIDKKYIKFETKASWYVQIIKLVLGFAIALGIKSGLSSLLVSLFGNEFVARSVRYFLVVMFAGVIWPITFKYFAKIKITPLDNFGVRVKDFFSKKA
jgi:undecaprenyl-diphosphatase